MPLNKTREITRPFSLDNLEIKSIRRSMALRVTITLTDLSSVMLSESQKYSRIKRERTPE